MKTLISVVISSLVLFACQSKEPDQIETLSTLGELEHDFQISSEAAEDFDKGLLLIHSFEYDDAMTAFQAAKEKDSTEIMAYWGEAMSHYKALWGLQDKRAGYAVLEELGTTKEERLSRITDPLEKDFWEGVEILYGDGSLKDRNERFNLHMKNLSEKYPTNQEAMAFYALSMMWDNNKEEDDTEVGKRAAEIAKGILAENPMHPGALHYTIHAYDNPIMAPNAMDQAEKYAKVAPDATHALHMPSHIFLAQGMWPEVVASNEASYAASVKRMERLGLSDEARGYHSYAWLHYAYLQQGRVEEATRLLANMSNFFKNTQSKGIRSYIASMQAAQLFETGVWPDGLSVLDIDKSDLGLSTHSREALLDARLAINDGDLGKVDGIIEQLSEEIRKGELYVSEDKAAMCSAGPSRYAPNKDGITKAKVALNQLHAMKYLADGKEVEAESSMKKATELEEASDYSFGPSDLPLPSFEMYGYYLLEKGDLTGAVGQFNKSLDRAPKRRNALLGLKRAYEELQDGPNLQKVESTLAGFNIDKSLTSL